MIFMALPISQPPTRVPGRNPTRPGVPGAAQKPVGIGAKGEILEPLVEGFKIEAKRIKDVKEVLTVLSFLQFLEVVETKDGLVLINVERRDIRKNPYLFSIMYLREKSIEIVYSYVPDVSPKKRRLEILRYLLNILTLLESVYFINHAQLYQVIDSVASRLFEYTASTYDEIYSKYDATKEDLDRLNKRNTELLEVNEKLTKTNIELKSHSSDLELRVKELETVSDEILIAKVQTWLAEHGYEINIADFSRVNRISETRVEQILNKMVRQGYLTLRES